MSALLKIKLNFNKKLTRMISSFILLGVLIVSGCTTNTPKKLIREPAVAGMWYPTDKTELQNTIQTFLNNVPSEQIIKDNVYGIIAPHAGYAFSGQTAAYAFKQLIGKTYETVIIIGPKHPPKSNTIPDLTLRGIYVDCAYGYKTPLGTVDIDTSIAKKLISCDKIFYPIPETGTDEHSVEAEIPFLQATLTPNFKIVPIIMTDHSYETCKILAEAIIKTIKGKNILIVASSDLYHGYDYEECKTSVNEACSLISQYDINNFYSALINKNIACGGAPIITLMLICKELNATNVIPLYKTNSGDVTGKKGGWIVGYSSFAFTKNTKTEFKPLDAQAQKELLKMARSTIESYAKKKERLKFKPAFPILSEKRGVFVTLLTKDDDLRGCIGHHESDTPLYELVPEMALASAFQDFRFSPLTEKELTNIKIKISVYLTNVYEIKDTSEYELGVHGIIMEKNGRASTFLPEVPTEQKWTKEETFYYLSQKAGLPVDAWKQGAKFLVYKTQVFGE
ncbi:MAG: AmmeMemoRadiSam system protein B [bacterium]